MDKTELETLAQAIAAQVSDASETTLGHIRRAIREHGADFAHAVARETQAAQSQPPVAGRRHPPGKRFKDVLERHISEKWRIENAKFEPLAQTMAAQVGDTAQATVSEIRRAIRKYGLDFVQAVVQEAQEADARTRSRQPASAPPSAKPSCTF